MTLSSQIKSTIGRNINNLTGWKTDRKIVVIESDDWGSIRMPSKKVFNELVKKGYPIDRRPFEKYDTLASEEDLDILFDTLKSIKNSIGQNPIITANTVVANPNFSKIEQNGFKKYFYEPFTDTLENYYPHSKTFLKWKEGIEEKLFFPQFHAREHYNIIKWMKLLQSKNVDQLVAFNFGMVGVPSKTNLELGNQLQIALGIENDGDIELQKQILDEGLMLFKSIFKYDSKTFIAPVYTWNEQLNEFLAQKGIKYLQGGLFQKSPDLKSGITTVRRHFLGEQNAYNQIHLIRNVFFEPSTNDQKDWVNESLKYVRNAFFWKKPVVICTHRLNYIGTLDINNRQRGIKLLSELLLKIIKKYPEVEFMTSEQLGDLIRKRKKNENSNT